jgi:hypothetical protein
MAARSNLAGQSERIEQMEHLPDAAVREDRRLESRAEGAGWALAEHRWRWTLDESNASRVSVRQYARDVDRGRTTIGQYAKAWELRSSGSATGLADALQRVNMGAERETAAQAVADARGISVNHARTAHSEEIRSVHASAAEAAEKEGTTISETAPRLASFRHRAREGQRRLRAEQRARHGSDWWTVQAEMFTIRRSMRVILDTARDGVKLDAEERDVIEFEMRQADAMFRLVRFAVEGRTDVDWDAELAALDAERTAIPEGDQ